jgi:hypothetical protein
VIISSRTPEGERRRCPICGNDLRIEPSVPTRDAPCPTCGCLIWFSSLPPREPSRLGRLAVRVCLRVVPVCLVVGFLLPAGLFGFPGLVVSGLILALIGRRLFGIARWLGKLSATAYYSPFEF